LSVPALHGDGTPDRPAPAVRRCLTPSRAVRRCLTPTRADTSGTSAGRWTD